MKRLLLIAIIISAIINSSSINLPPETKKAILKKLNDLKSGLIKNSYWNEILRRTKNPWKIYHVSHHLTTNYNANALKGTEECTIIQVSNCVDSFFDALLECPVLSFTCFKEKIKNGCIDCICAIGHFIGVHISGCSYY